MTTWLTVTVHCQVMDTGFKHNTVKRREKKEEKSECVCRLFAPSLSQLYVLAKMHLHCMPAKQVIQHFLKVLLCIVEYNA